MAGSDPTQAPRLVQVDIPPSDRVFLEELITMSRDGVREELADSLAGCSAPGELRREGRAHERLLAGLKNGTLESDADVRAVLAALSEVVDASNEYARVVFEHRALRRLIGIAADGA